MALPVAVPNVGNASQASFKQWALTAADGDSGEVLFNHGFVDEQGNDVQPAHVVIEPRDIGFTVGQWAITTLNATQIGITKTLTVVGSGTNVNALVVTAMRPHTSILS